MYLDRDVTELLPLSLYSPIHAHSQLPMVLLGNKSDLNAIREVEQIRPQTWARCHGIRPYEVNVINRDSLKDPFCYITWRMANPGMTC